MWHDVMCTEANVPACERGKLAARQRQSGVLIGLQFVKVVGQNKALKVWNN